jgi:hypothetical protein
MDIYKETRVFEYPNAIVRVRIPDLDDEEQNRRMALLKAAAANVLKKECGK